ncbi:DUF6390 family protein [Mycobacterium lentiflavum]|uniref:DUF6390 family protein n=1 Tax=Mycobacterium lentiflavum TaxID=141349 RepID=UPI0030845DE4
MSTRRLRAPALGAPAAQRVRWRKDGVSLINAPTPGDTVSTHWGWVCDTLTAGERSALARATQTTLDVVNEDRNP